MRVRLYLIDLVLYCAICFAIWPLELWRYALAVVLLVLYGFVRQQIGRHN